MLKLLKNKKNDETCLKLDDITGILMNILILNLPQRCSFPSPTPLQTSPKRPRISTSKKTRRISWYRWFQPPQRGKCNSKRANILCSKSKITITRVKKGGFLKWWVSPTTPWVFLLKMISTWGVKWGYHHLRKHPYTYAASHGLAFYSGAMGFQTALSLSLYDVAHECKYYR